MEYLVYKEEASYHRVPGLDMGVGGVTWVGPALMVIGSEEQKREHLPMIAKGESVWCTGYSEPGAGSDLASLQTRAVEDGDDYVINGQKVWTSAAHRADWCWLAARTDPDAPKHKGISMFLLDMKTPGVTVRPLISMTGSHDLNEVFLDDVRIPKTNLVGEKNRGWYHLAMALDFERTVGVGMVAGEQRSIDDLTGYVKEKGLGGDPIIRHRMADLIVEANVARLLAYRLVWLQVEGRMANFEASISKNAMGVLSQHVGNVGMQILGLYGQLEEGSKWAQLRGRIALRYQFSLAGNIAGGTLEVNKNIIAQRGLGMPRG